MSTRGNSASPLLYFCYQCDCRVTIAPPSSPNAELVCPNCHGGFLEELDAAPQSNPDILIPDPFFSPNPFSGGFPIVFSSAGGLGRGFDDHQELFGQRSPNEFNPFAFLNDYINNLQSRGANIQLVFETPGGGGTAGGGGVDFRLPMNFGDYFIGPGLEQLIQQLAENDPNRYGTPPASKSAVEGLPDVKITEQMLASDSSQCAVCKDSFELNEEVKQIPCKHIYHKDCIMPWLEMHNSCPVCRYELPTDDQDYENRRTSEMNHNGNRNINNSNSGSGDRGTGDDANNNNTQSPRTVERRFRISLPWFFRGFGSQAETSNNGGGGGSGDGGNATANNSSGPSNPGSRGGGGGGGGRGQAREEDLD